MVDTSCEYFLRVREIPRLIQLIYKSILVALKKGDLD